MTAPTQVVTIGETMALVRNAESSALTQNAQLSLSFGGSESNVAIGLARLGVPATWFSRLGADPFARLILRELRAEGVDVRCTTDPDRPTGLLIKERLPAGRTSVIYYRRGSAASALDIGEIDLEVVARARILHLTGITLALSSGNREVLQELAQTAQDNGVTVSFDFNFRSKLWSREDARAAYERILPFVDLCFGGAEEVALALGVAADTHPAELAQGLRDVGINEAVVKLGEDGAFANDGGQELSMPAVKVEVVDTVGAGDAFVAGYLSERVRDAPLTDRLAVGVKAGAFACLGPGDWESLPHTDELDQIGGGSDPVIR